MGVKDYESNLLIEQAKLEQSDQEARPELFRMTEALYQDVLFTNLIGDKIGTITTQLPYPSMRGRPNMQTIGLMTGGYL